MVQHRSRHGHRDRKLRRRGTDRQRRRFGNKSKQFVSSLSMSSCARITERDTEVLHRSRFKYLSPPSGKAVERILFLFSSVEFSANRTESEPNFNKRLSEMKLEQRGHIADSDSAIRSFIMNEGEVPSLHTSWLSIIRRPDHHAELDLWWSSSSIGARTEGQETFWFVYF
ncbi:hypothetical protein Q8A73_006086 [Channa argus]|nr:hypothetical protein Q8A73_006086 [Channa argus]